jgi:hypothetical protein
MWRHKALMTGKPLAAPGLLSYRYRSRYGWIMIGAHNDSDALHQAGRSLSYGEPDAANLQRWDGAQYVDAASLAY